MNTITVEDFIKLSDQEQQQYLAGLDPNTRAAFTQQLPAGAPALPPAPSVSPSVPATSAAPDFWAGVKDNLNKLTGPLSTVVGVAATMTDMANTAHPEQATAGSGAVTGAVQGALGGAAAGPLGMFVGGIAGALSGAVKAGSQREAYEQEQARKLRTSIEGLRMAPTLQEKGGVVDDEVVEEIPIQAEKGELLLLPDMRLVDAMANKPHSKMKGDEVTDIVPNPTIVLSNSDKKAIDLKKVKDDILTITRGTYSETGNTRSETIRFGDIFGKTGKITPAQAGKKIRKMFPVLEKPVEAIEVSTNAENIRRRMELLQPIIEMQEGVYKKFEFEKPMKFELGGPVFKNKKYPSPEEFAQLSREDQQSWYLEIPEDEIGAYAQFGLHVPVTDRSGVVDPGFAPLPSLPIRGVRPNTVAEQKMADGTAPPQLRDPYAGPDPTEKPKTVFDANQAQVEKDYADTVLQNESLFRRQRLRNLGILATKLAGTAMQNPNVEPVTQSADHVNSMYPNITESQVQSQISGVRQDQNRAITAASESGLSGTRLGAAIAGTQARLIEAGSRIRQNAVGFNISQNAARFKHLNQLVNANRAAETQAQNATQSNRNRMISTIAGTGADFVSADAGLDQSVTQRLQELKQWRQKNLYGISSDRMSNEFRGDERGMRVEDARREQNWQRLLIENLFKQKQKQEQ